MPPQRIALVAAAAPELCSSALAPLPLVLAQRIFVSLPVDSRARAACVAPAWRDALADPTLWTRLDLSEESGVAEALVCDALLQGAARRAHGQLHHLNVAGSDRRFTRAVLLEVLAANAGSLRELHVAQLDARYADETFAVNPAALTAAAPLLQALSAGELHCYWEAAAQVMRSEPPWAPLRFSALWVFFTEDADEENFGGLERVAPFAAALADAALHPELSKVAICDADTELPEVMDALADAALARRLHRLTLDTCPPPAPAPLARLLAGGALADLVFDNNPQRGDPLFDAAGAALVADALRATTALTSLTLFHSGLCDGMPAALTLLGALVGHLSLRSLTLTSDPPYDDDAPALGAALAALVAADAPALQELDISGNALGDDGMAQIVDALPRNNHLRRLNISYNGISEAFARARLLPALRANTGLQMLKCVDRSDCGDVKARLALAEAEQLASTNRRAQRS